MYKSWRKQPANQVNKQTNNKARSCPQLLSCSVSHQIQENLWYCLKNGQGIFLKYFDAYHKQYIL